MKQDWINRVEHFIKRDQRAKYYLHIAHMVFVTFEFTVTLLENLYHHTRDNVAQINNEIFPLKKKKI